MTVTYHLIPGNDSASEMQKQQIYSDALLDKNQFIVNGHLNMRQILERFYLTKHPNKSVAFAFLKLTDINYITMSQKYDLQSPARHDYFSQIQT